MLIIALLLGGCRQEEETLEFSDLEQSADVRKIVAVGDSLTAGLGVDESESYPALLEHKLRSAGFDYQVINAGVSGETSSGTLSRIEWVMTLEPDVVILETGANDGLRGIAPSLVKDNIRQILSFLERQEVVVLLVGMKMVWNLGPEYVDEFNRIYPDLAEEFGTVFMPFFLEGVAVNNTLNLADGVHPNKQGYAVITENLYPYVVAAIKRLEANE